MELSERRVADVAILELIGKFTTPDDRGQLRRKVIELILRGERHIVFDLSHLTDIDSSGLGGFVTCHSRACRNGATIALAQPGRRVRELLVVTRLSMALDCYESEEQALESVGAAVLV